MNMTPIQPRKVVFDVTAVPRHWNGGDPVLTRFLMRYRYIFLRARDSLSSRFAAFRIR